jgi:hypothetical protein
VKVYNIKKLDGEKSIGILKQEENIKYSELREYWKYYHKLYKNVRVDELQDVSVTIHREE